mmetsp:Transcript_4494/g.18287  ORF Transcript_4494/g.18287 Transcript_4494/m.18287 type:complete len:301 (+) Transcript_4494:847-1749(+)
MLCLSLELRRHRELLLGSIVLREVDDAPFARGGGSRVFRGGRDGACGVCCSTSALRRRLGEVDDVVVVLVGVFWTSCRGPRRRRRDDLGGSREEGVPLVVVVVVVGVKVVVVVGFLARVELFGCEGRLLLRRSDGARQRRFGVHDDDGRRLVTRGGAVRAALARAASRGHLGRIVVDALRRSASKRGRRRAARGGPPSLVVLVVGRRRDGRRLRLGRQRRLGVVVVVFDGLDARRAALVLLLLRGRAATKWWGVRLPLFWSNDAPDRRRVRRGLPPARRAHPRRPAPLDDDDREWGRQPR